MAYHGVDGTVLAVKQAFVDEEDQPLYPASGYPKVRLYDKAGEMLLAVTAVASSEPGQWTANLPVPRMDLEQRTEFVVKWRFKDDGGTLHRSSEVALIEPSTDRRESDIVMKHGAASSSISLPVSFQVDWTGEWQVYYRNAPCIAVPPKLQDLPKNIGIDKSVFTLPLAEIPYASLEAYLLSVEVTPPFAKTRTYNYKIYAITPQIMLAMSHLEDFLNKSRVEQIIPELRYCDGDLMVYLERGLYMFNRVGYPTGFNGTNMQGSLFDAWLICAQYWALSAQLLAEGSLAFDFSGQGVSLNVDRTPQIEGALGRMESLIESQVVPLKKLLNAQGITQGDGSVGSTSLNNPSSVGRMQVVNAQTTRLPAYATSFVNMRRSRG